MDISLGSSIPSPVKDPESSLRNDTSPNNSLLQLLSARTLLLCLTSMAGLLWLWCCASLQHYKGLKLPPGSMGLPFLGETLRYLLEGYAFFERRQRRHGNIYKTHLLGSPLIRVTGAENLRLLFNSEHSLVSTRWPLSARMMLGNGAISISSGATHRQLRKELLTAFNSESLSQYALPMQETVAEYVTRWCATGEVFGYQECRRLVFSVACRLLVGMDLGLEQETELCKSFEDFTDNVFSLPVNLPGFGLHRGLKARRLLLQRIEACITQKMNHKATVHHHNVLSKVLEHQVKGTLNLELLKDQVLELMFAGHETTASAACTLLLYLHREPQVVENACAELHTLGFMDMEPDAELPYDIITRLEYVKWMVKEALRVVPPVGGVYKTALKTFNLGGYQIPEGCAVVCGIQGTHRTAPDFYNFDPDRWRRGWPNCNDYFPFGAGSRACAGKEFATLLLKIFVVEMVRKCSWKIRNARPKMVDFPVPHPKDMLPVEFREAPTLRRNSV